MCQVGTLLYIAPEIVKGECYDERCDVYSFGMVLLAMAHLTDDIITLFAEEVQCWPCSNAMQRNATNHRP